MMSAPSLLDPSEVFQGISTYLTGTRKKMLAPSLDGSEAMF
jgi:hypothetical protein